MQHLAVHWHEGLFLRPHHLQAWDRHWDERTTSAARWSNPHDYGIASIQVCQDALVAGFFQLNAIRCKMPEGSLVEIVPGESTLRRDLRSALALVDDSGPAFNATPNGTYVDVFLAIGRLQLGTDNVAEPRLYQPPDEVAPAPEAASTEAISESAAATPVATGDRTRRFDSLQIRLHDESDAASVEPILVRRMNARLMLSTEDTSAYETIRIARVLPGVDDGALARIDQRVIPPVLHVGGSHALRVGILSRLHDRVQHRVKLL